MDARERHALEYDHDGEPRLLAFTPRSTPRTVLHWTDADICVCGVKCAIHWNAAGEWIGCKAAGQVR